MWCRYFTHNVGLEDLEEPMCLSNPSSYNGNQSYWGLCEIQHFSQQVTSIALGEDPETQRQVVILVFLLCSFPSSCYLEGCYAKDFFTVISQFSFP